MSSAVLTRMRNFDAAAWRAATWLTPVAVQIVVAMLFALDWVASTWALPLLLLLPFIPSEGAMMLTGTVVITVASLLTGAALVSAKSLRRRGFGLAIAASGLAVLAGMAVYVGWVLPILEPA